MTRQLSFDPHAAEADLVSVPETFQKGICLAGMGLLALAYGVSALLEINVGFLPLVIAVGALLGIIYYAAKRIPRFQNRFTLYPNGIRFNLTGKTVDVAYEDIQSIWFLQKHYHQIVLGSNQYIGTEIQLELGVKDQLRVIQYQGEYRNGKPSAAAALLLCNRCVELVHNRLRDELETTGFVQWSHDIRLTLDGFQILDGTGQIGREIDFDEVESFDVQDNFVLIWEKRSQTPFAKISTRTANTVPLYSLMRTLFMTYRYPDQVVVDETSYLPEAIR